MSSLLRKRQKSKTEVNTQNEDLNEVYPTNMDDYEFEGRIGKGAFASVFIAKCKSKNNERVAIKVIELELNRNDDSVSKSNDNNDKNKKKNKKKEENNNNENDISMDDIQKEAAIMARMNHQNIVRCLASFSVTTELWLVMPMLIGSCSDIMKSVSDFNYGFIDEYIISTIIRDVLCGVQYIHGDGRVHRDIKAANILLSSSGLCQISDFGVSGAIIEGGLRKNGRHTFTGSLWWMSPEILQRENRHSYKADIWSIGITSLELAFSRPPHSKQRPVKVMLTILQSAPPTIQTCIEESDNKNISYKYSKKFKDFLSKCLQKDANKRLSATQLLNHSFIKQAKDANYLKEKVVALQMKNNEKNGKKINQNILPYSVSQKIKKIKKEQEKLQNNYQSNSTKVESIGPFDFDSNIHSMSQSDKKEDIKQKVEALKQQQKEQKQNENEHEKNNQKQQPQQNTETVAMGRFQIKIQNQNESNDSNQNTEKDDGVTSSQKGRFTVKKMG